MWITFDGAGHHSTDMYSVAIPYLEIRPVRAAMSSFAAQIVETRLLEEAQVGIDKDNGMHASIMSHNEAGRVEWASIGTYSSHSSKSLAAHAPCISLYASNCRSETSK
jgi:hypothetical protein